MPILILSTIKTHLDWSLHRKGKISMNTQQELYYIQLMIAKAVDCYILSPLLYKMVWFYYRKNNRTQPCWDKVRGDRLNTRMKSPMNYYTLSPLLFQMVSSYFEQNNRIQPSWDKGRGDRLNTRLESSINVLYRSTKNR